MDFSGRDFIVGEFTYTALKVDVRLKAMGYEVADRIDTGKGAMSLPRQSLVYENDQFHRGRGGPNRA
jgi:hypothetical protein